MTAVPVTITVTLDGAAITDWETFHAESQKAFGFPDFYGRNMDAWIDCLSYLRDDDGMSKFKLAPDAILQIKLQNADSLRRHAPDILEELKFCIAAVNERYAEYGENPALSLILC